MAKVTKIFTQTTKKGVDQSQLVLTVDYDPKEKEVIDISSVYSFDCARNITTDLTYIFAEQFSKALDEMIAKVDWSELYKDIKYETALIN